MELEEGQVKQVLEAKGSLAARLHRSPDLLDALLMTFTYQRVSDSSSMISTHGRYTSRRWATRTTPTRRSSSSTA